MQKVTLLYTDLVGGIHTKDFDIFGANIYDVELIKNIHKKLNGGYEQDSMGYFNHVEIDFFPLKADKEALFFIHGFSFGSNRQIQVNAPDNAIQSVMIPEGSIDFEHVDNVYFANGFRMRFKERGLNRISDNLSMKTLRPVYSRGASGISGDTYEVFVNLVDESSVEIIKENLEFVDRQVDDKAFGYVHKFTIDFGRIATQTERDWLRDFCLWQNKTIDTTGIDSTNGGTYQVVCLNDMVKWDFQAGLHAQLVTTLLFVEKNPRNTPELYNASPFILDDETFGRLDNNVLG